MKRIVFSLLALTISVLAMAQMQPLPNDPEVRTGKLDNGLTYYIRHNSLPAGRAEFYLATDVGAIQEAPDQDGLAHFLEHMCFNGLKNLPGKQMLDYLQHIGAEFGRNINASTGIEHTQYMLNNMPVTREGILDTCLLVMHDYSHFVLNDPVEIDAERGVILEEKRTRNNASWRMFEKSAPYIYGASSKYATCNIIGSEENLKNFRPESLKNFYETWYRPDMQALIVVGDIDVDQVYDKIVRLFADIPAPAEPTVKVMPEVEFNEQPVAAILLDPENTSTSVDFIWKLGQPAPKEQNGTGFGYLERMVKIFIRSIMAERFDDIASKADAPFINASFSVGNLCATCEAVLGDVTFENGKTDEAVRAYLTEVEKLRRFGVTDDEMDRVKDDLIKMYKNKVAGKDSRKNPDFIRPIMNHFFEGHSYMTPETELAMAEQFCGAFKAEILNQMLPQVLQDIHFTMIYQGVDREGQVHPTPESLLAIAAEVKASEIKANSGESISKDFMAGIKIKPGKVKKSAKGLYDSEVWTLSNGLKVVVLPTEYKKNQILMDLRKNGGTSTVPTEDIASLTRDISGLFINNSGVAGYSKTTTGKMLSGKTVNMAPYFNQVFSGVNGSCAPEDIETALQLMNLYITNPRFDEEEWNTGIKQLNAVLPNLVNTPNYAFSKHIYDAIYNSPRFSMLSQETIDKASMDVFAKYYRYMLGDIAGATLYIVGDVKPAEIKDLVAKYCGSLPKGKKALAYNAVNLPNYRKGEYSDVFQTVMNTPKVSVLQMRTAQIPYTMQKEVDLDAANFILDMIYVETLRESEGGTYGASSAMSLSYYPVPEAMIQTQFDTNVAQQQRLRELAVEGLTKLAAEGPTEEQLTRAIENAKKNLPEKRINNSYWLNNLKFNELTGIEFDAAYEAAVNGISAEGIKAVLSEILAAGNFTEVVMTPAE